MGLTKSESKYLNTALLMDEALIGLLGEKDLQYVTVKEICQRAGVNRSTFYLHYETMGDLLDETVGHILEEFIGRFPVDAGEFVGNVGQAPLDELILVKDEFLVPYLEYVKENERVFRAALNNPGGLRVGDQMADLGKHVLRPILSRFGVPKEEQEYWIAYHIHGVMAIVIEWLKLGCAESVGDIARIVQDCVRPGQGRLG